MTEITNQKVVVLLTIDCLRNDHLKSYNYHRNTAPNLEKIAKKGVVFSHAVSNGPETASSFSSIFTSVLPYLNGDFSPLPNYKEIFPQFLYENEVFSYAIHSNPNVGALFNYHRGFNIFYDGLEEDILYMGVPKRKKKKGISKIILEPLIKNIFPKIWKGILDKVFTYVNKKVVGFDKMRDMFSNFDFIKDRLVKLNRRYFTASFIVRQVIKFINKYNSHKPLFVWAHFMDVHWPYNPRIKNLLKYRDENINNHERNYLLNNVFWSPKGRINKDRLNKLIDLYDGAINFVDEHLANLLAVIRQKFKKDCLIIITADHGDGFYEHGYLNHGGHVNNELLNVPLLIIENGNNPKVNRIDNFVELLDIAPTILDYFGITIPGQFQGKSLLPFLQGKPVKNRSLIISESHQRKGRFTWKSNEGFKIFGIRVNPWKYIYDEEKKKEFIFNLKEDPNEKVNLIEKNTELLKIFREIRNNHFEDIPISDEMAKIAYTVKELNFKGMHL